MIDCYWVAFFVAFSHLVGVFDASAGDADPLYRVCIEGCKKSGCVGERCFPHCKFPSDGVSLDSPSYMQEPLYLWWKQWDCQSDCRYYCMVDREKERAALGHGPVKYHGKWPFKRVYGIQEPVSVALSALNLAMHFHGWLSFFILLYYKLPLKPDKKTYYDYTGLWHIYGLLSLNSWFWSAVFHSRDVDVTEKLDYSSAVALLGYSLILAILTQTGQELHVYFIRSQVNPKLEHPTPETPSPTTQLLHTNTNRTERPKEGHRRRRHNRNNQFKMNRDVAACNTYNYGDALYWDARYIQEGGSFDWYQRYSALRPFVRKYLPTSSRVLMVGCGNAVMSEDMVKDGFEDIMNVDISSVAIDMMRRKYEHIPQLKYMQMDVRDMSFFPDETFDGVIDKGTLDSLMCGTDAPISAAQMLGEVSRLLKPGGIYMMITYGDPKVRTPHLSRPVYSWKIELYIIPRPGFQRPAGSTSTKSYLEPVPITAKGLLPAEFVLEDPDSHFIYVCRKMDETTDLGHVPTYPLTNDVL